MEPDRFGCVGMMVDPVVVTATDRDDVRQVISEIPTNRPGDDVLRVKDTTTRDIGHQVDGLALISVAGLRFGACVSRGVTGGSSSR